MKYLKIELNGKQIDMIPVNDELALCDGCYGLIEFCEKTWELNFSCAAKFFKTSSQILSAILT